MRKQKSDWKSNLLWIFVGIVLSNITLNSFSYFTEYLAPKPNVEINLIRMQRINLNEFNSSGYTLLFLKSFGGEYVLLHDINYFSKQVAGTVITTIPHDDEALYTLYVVNTGDKEASGLEIILKTTEYLSIIEGDPKNIEERCGGMFDSKGCYLESKNLFKNDNLHMVLNSSKLSNVEVDCKVDGKRQNCFVNIFDLYVQEVVENETAKFRLWVNGKFVELPKTQRMFRLYYYNVDEDRWVEIPLDEVETFGLNLPEYPFSEDVQIIAEPEEERVKDGETIKIQFVLNNREIENIQPVLQIEYVGCSFDLKYSPLPRNIPKGKYSIFYQEFENITFTLEKCVFNVSLIDSREPNDILSETSFQIEKYR